MKKKVLLLALVGFILSFSSYAFAVTITPSPADLNDLDHCYYYLWKPTITLGENEVITEATLTIKNIWNWTYHEATNRLFTHLLDDPSTSGGQKIGGTATNSSWRWWDNQSYYVYPLDNKDNWKDSGPLIGTWSDPEGGYARNFNLVYTFSTLGLVDDLNAYVQDGNFGIGFDPDCHYWNSGIELTYTTKVTPEPISSALFLLGGGAIATRIYRKKKKA